MNKLLKGILCVGLCGSLMFSFGCGKTKNNDSETRSLQLSVGAIDRNFNPFFYSAQNDGEMLSNTQIGMLTVDESGNLVAGQNNPTVVLDYKETKYSSSGSIITDDVSTVDRTEYQFVIKNGIKFSDGEPLTILDVLFNLYVYLDPAYTGSSTIYSTDIQGLKAYRAQDNTITDDKNVDTDAVFRGEAQDRIQTLIDWSTSLGTVDEISINNNSQALADLETVKKLFRTELESDWTSISSSWYETYKDTNHFTETWQAYLYSEGLATDQYVLNENQTYTKIKDSEDKVYTTLEPWQPGNSVNGKVGEIGGQHYIDQIVAASTDEKVQQYMKDNPSVTDKEVAKEELIKEASIDIVFNFYADDGMIYNVLMFWQTASTVLEQFTNEQRAIYFQKQKDDGLGVDTISGITFTTMTGSELTTGFKGVGGEAFPDAEYSVLKIVINGVDPKAIYNFSFTVAPLHYYSGVYTDEKGVKTDYVALAKSNYTKTDGTACFGVDVGNPDFYQTVLQADSKTGVPVGAGPYVACDSNGKPTSDKNAFVNNNIVHFVRNDNFTTTGTGVDNAKIRLVDFKVLADDQIMSSLVTGSIDFGMPTATPTNVATVDSNKSFLGKAEYDTGGYGYIGINPKFVPEYKVRQAIMKAMDTTQTIAYYGTGLASVIYRPMTKTSWAYPEGVGEYKDIAYYEDIEEIKKLVKDAGYELKNGVYTKVEEKDGMANAKIGATLKLSFIIAGDTTNHPAYQMFQNASKTLNEIGFDIDVRKSANALQDMATGNLAVWAAAWSSSIDPDPYQVYHKDSNATSVLNWNYVNILNNASEWEYEYDIIMRLSDLIDQGRATTTQNVRAGIYHECLDLIMDLAVELPTYQRKDLCVYNKNIIDASTLVQNPSFNMGLFDKLWEIDYV